MAAAEGSNDYPFLPVLALHQGLRLGRVCGCFIFQGAQRWHRLTPWACGWLLYLSRRTKMAQAYTLGVWVVDQGALREEHSQEDM